MSIAAKDIELQIKILVVSHYSAMGHSEMNTTKRTLRKKFWVETMDVGVEEFVRGCFILHRKKSMKCNFLAAFSFITR